MYLISSLTLILGTHELRKWVYPFGIFHWIENVFFNVFFAACLGRMNDNIKYRASWGVPIVTGKLGLELQFFEELLGKRRRWPLDRSNIVHLVIDIDKVIVTHKH